MTSGKNLHQAIEIHTFLTTSNGAIATALLLVVPDR